MKSGFLERRCTVPSGVFFKRGLLLAAGLLCGVRLWACGPFFPETILDADTASVLAAPSASLASELALLGVGREGAVFSCVHQGVEGSLPFELEELRAALLARGAEASSIAGLVARYAELRKSEGLRTGPGSSASAEPACPAEAQEEAGLVARGGAAGNGSAVSEQGSAGKAAQAGGDLSGALAALSQEIPAEFVRYLEGALSWRAGDKAAATQQWLGLLALPEAERKYRSVWAAYMLGRCALEDLKGLKGAEAERAGEEACRWFVQTRSYAARGFNDVAGLASESLGWEGQAALLQGDFARALSCYYQQHRAGDETAFQSLRVTAARALEAGAPALKKLAADPLCRRLMTAFVVSRVRESVYDDYRSEESWRGQSRDWCAALGSLTVGPLPEADHMAWLAYDAGEIGLAGNWLVHAADSSPITWWLRAKIVLHEDGSREEAELLYREALKRPGLDAGQLRGLQSELGRLCLARDEFEQALEAWLAADDWEAAAYVAERVLDTKVLQTWVEAQPFETPEARQRLEPLRYLLARRLAREGSVAGVKYFPVALAPVYRTYLAQVRRAFDEQEPALVRARSFMAAARLVRRQGMELLGTELAPDGFIYGGSFPMGERQRERVYGSKDPLAVSQAEQEQVLRHPLPQQGRRYHYRYRAAELAWLGASLMPNDNEETAAILCEAGSWLKDRDPGAADLFYKALVVRCPRTLLGGRAAELHWFPELPEPETSELSEESPDWGVRPGWLLACWALAVAVPLGTAFAVSRRRRRAS